MAGGAGRPPRSRTRNPEAAGWLDGPLPSGGSRPGRRPLPAPAGPNGAGNYAGVGWPRQPGGHRIAGPPAQPRAARQLDLEPRRSHHPAGAAPAGAGPRSPAQRPQPAAAAGELGPREPGHPGGLRPGQGAAGPLQLGRPAGGGSQPPGAQPHSPGQQGGDGVFAGEWGAGGQRLAQPP